MARRGRMPSPWLRNGTGTWYATIDGVQTYLGRGKREAHAEFARIMAARGQGVVSHGKVTVRDLAELWLDDCRTRIAATTVATYEQHINLFVARCGGVQARDLRPFHVNQWVASRSDAQSTQHLAITVVKCLTSWGDAQGYLESDPLKRLKRPGMTRRKSITLEEAEAVIACVSPNFQVALRLLLALGVRPGELCSLTAGSIDVKARYATVRGKAGVRTIPLTEATLGILEPLARERPLGRLLQSQRGPLTVSGLEHAVYRGRVRACKILGRPDDGCDHVTPHCFRGLFSTEALRAGVDSLLVSKLLGHRDPSVLARHYASPDDAMMRDAMERATRKPGTGAGSPPGPGA